MVIIESNVHEVVGWVDRILEKVKQTAVGTTRQTAGRDRSVMDDVVADLGLSEHG